MKVLIIYILLFIFTFNYLIVDINAQSDKNYYQIEEDGYFINPQQTQFGVVCSDNFSSRIYLIKNGEISVLIETPGCGRYFSVSSDGSKIGYKLIDSEGQSPHVYDLRDETDYELNVPVELCGQPVFDINGNLYFTIAESLIIISEDSRTSFDLNYYSNIISPSPGGERIAFANRRGALSILEVESGEIFSLKNTETCLYPVWSPDGQKLAFNSVTGELYIWDNITDKIVEIDNGGSPVWMDNSQGVIYQQNRYNGESFSSDLLYYNNETEELINLTNTPNINECNPSIYGDNILYQTFEDRRIIKSKFNLQTLSIEKREELMSWPDTLKIKYYTLDKSDYRNYIFLGESPYVNQMYDTPDFHDGTGACGPTTAIMTLAYYNRLPAWPTEVDKLFLHINDYGSYISDLYHFNEYYYDAYTSPYGSDSWGAYSYMWSGSGSPNSTMAYYYENHLISTVQQWTTQCSFQNTVDEIDNGYTHTICAFMTASGHILMAKGYDDVSHSLIFHDPYGDRNTPGYPSYDGNDVIYDWPGYNNGYQNLDPDGSHGGVAWTIKTQSDEPVYNDTIIDDLNFGHGFFIFNEPPSHMKYFRDQATGYDSHSWWTVTIDSDDVCFVSWEPTIPQTGYYEVSTFIPSDYSDAEQSNYQLNLSGLDTTIIINQSEYSDEWVLLGWFDLYPDSVNKVSLGDSTGIHGQSMVFDAMKFSRIQTVGVEEISVSQSFGLNVFPNPAIDLLNIKLPNTINNSFIKLDVFNANMQLVESYQLVSNSDDVITIPVSKFRNGIYFIELSSEMKVYYSRFMVK